MESVCILVGIVAAIAFIFWMFLAAETTSIRTNDFWRDKHYRNDSTFKPKRKHKRS